KTAIEDHFDHSHELRQLLSVRGKSRELAEISSLLPVPGQVVYLRQQEPRGLGHAVWCARNLIGDEPVAILLADDLIQAKTPCLKQMVAAFHERGGSVVAVMEVPREQTQRYGVIKPGSDDGRLVEIQGLIEKPKPEAAPSRLSIIGRYILQPEI